MNVKNRRPTFAPIELVDMPKADLSDLVWEFAGRLAGVGGEDSVDERKRIIIQEWRVHRAHDAAKRLPRTMKEWVAQPVNHGSLHGDKTPGVSN